MQVFVSTLLLKLLSDVGVGSSHHPGFPCASSVSRCNIVLAWRGYVVHAAPPAFVGNIGQYVQ